MKKKNLLSRYHTRVAYVKKAIVIVIAKEHGTFFYGKYLCCKDNNAFESLGTLLKKACSNYKVNYIPIFCF